MQNTQAVQAAASQLRRVLGRWDLVLLFVVAVANLNIVPVVAANGPVTLWLWLLALICFFWPQGVAVIELSARYPGEGGVYLWTKQLFGDFHGFVSGWCYWTNNVFYVPTVLLYLVGIAVYVGGERSIGLADNRLFALLLSLGLLWLMVGLNVRGLAVGKWVNNLGGIGTATAAILLIGLAVYVVRVRGSTLSLASFSPRGADWRLISTFGVICFGLVGLELGSVMGDEIQEPHRTIPGAVLLGGLVSGALYVGATLALLLALPGQEIGVVQGVLQAISRMARMTGLGWLIAPLALVLTISTAGIASAWFSGSARIPFVAGLDRYLPARLGKVHARYHTPHVALILHALLSTLFLVMSFVGATVREAYITMLALAVVLQLVPFLYMYAGLVRLAAHGAPQSASYRRWVLWLAGVAGFITTALGMGLAFVPARQIESIWTFEIKLFVGCILFLGLATLFFWVYAGRRRREDWSLAEAEPGATGGPV